MVDNSLPVTLSTLVAKLVVTSVVFAFNASAVLTSEVFAFNASAVFTSAVFAFKFNAAVTSVAFAFKSSAACVAVDIGLSISLVLSTLASPTMALVIPDTVPVNVGDSIFAFKLIAVKYGLSIAAVSDVFNLPSAPFTLPA